MPAYSFYQIDVFTTRPFGGNQLAVFTDARGLSAEQMQTLTREMNFSESTFILPPDDPTAARRVRIFTPGMELPMAGHPTVGTAALLARLGVVQVPPGGGEAALELGIGPVRVVYEPMPQAEAAPAGGPQEPGRLPFVWMTHRAPQFGPTRSDRAAVAAALGLEPSDLRPDLPLQVVSTGVPFLFVPLASRAAAARAQSERAALARLFDGQEAASVALFTEDAAGGAGHIHCRMFAPHTVGVVEDPATGSMAAPLGAYLAQYGLLPAQPLARFVVEQGVEMLRPSQIHVEVGQVNGQVVTLRIGGDSVLVGRGEIFW